MNWLRGKQAEEEAAAAAKAEEEAAAAAVKEQRLKDRGLWGGLVGKFQRGRDRAQA